ncbi:MAG: class II aldolase/adducin family protein [Clostridiales bacterium]|nr:class II aldolase/adducin family protein [Clostridiales bacterium]
MVVDTLVHFSNKYGSDSELVLAGGGNTSAKENGILYVKGSGTSLSDITADGFVKMDIQKLMVMLDKKYPSGDSEREAAALHDLMAARLPSESMKRPSVETLLHAIFPQRYVLHLHPALINGLTCGADGKNIADTLFKDDILWIDICKPGYILANICNKKMKEYKARTGKDVSVMLLQNHGVFIADDTEGGLSEKLDFVMSTLRSLLTEHPDFSPCLSENAETDKFKAALVSLYGENSFAVYCGNKEAVKFSSSLNDADELLKPFTPDHIVYCKANPLFVESFDALRDGFEGYKTKYGYPPKIVMVKGMGFFAVGESEKKAETARLLFIDAMKIAVYSRSFGGRLPMTDGLTDFIINWEVESYRSKQN